MSRFAIQRLTRGLVAAVLFTAGAAADTGAVTAARGAVDASADAAAPATVPAGERSPKCTLDDDAPGGVAAPGIRYALVFAGERRHYRVLVAGPRRPGRGMAVVFDLHASGIDPATEARITGLPLAADGRDVLVVYPEAVTPFPDGGATWDVPAMGEAAVPRDPGFVVSVLDRLDVACGVDRDRVFALGFSGGARLASELACRHPQHFTAVGAVGGVRFPPLDDRRTACGEGAPVAVIALHGLRDPVNHYVLQPDSPPWWRHGIDDAVAAWAAHGGCHAIPAIDAPWAGVQRRRYRDCRPGAAVVLYRLASGGHVWPGSDFPWPARLGDAVTAPDATALIVRFFTEHGL